MSQDTGTTRELSYRGGAVSQQGARWAVPQSVEERRGLSEAVRVFMRSEHTVAPLSLAEIEALTRRFLQQNPSVPDAYAPFINVLVNNDVWRPVVARIPYRRRTLLLPPCLRSEENCRAEFDEFGLLCERCGSCSLASIVAEAESLGYAVLIAEGTGIVEKLIGRGMVDAVVGVSCMASLLRAFPTMVAEAVPALAVPLLRDGCSNTGVDSEWVSEFLGLSDSGGQVAEVSPARVRPAVEAWFTERALREVLQPGDSEAEKICLAWLSGSGKRWRPLMAVSTYLALGGDEDGLQADVRLVAVALECFHKASLIHDDIEDGDQWRYGQRTMHASHGIPVALNAGDLLLGEGYRLISNCRGSPSRVQAMLAVAANGHRELCLGQGSELAWKRRPAALGVGAVLDVFRLKTAPAFEVALREGALLAGHEDLDEVLGSYSKALGTAYQIQDDLRDFGTLPAEDTASGDWPPRLLLALAGESETNEVSAAVRRAWRPKSRSGVEMKRLQTAIRETGAEQRARDLLQVYRAESLASLSSLLHPGLKRLLFRLVGAIVPDGSSAKDTV